MGSTSLIDPKCLLIVGNITDGLKEDELKSFELFRSDLKSVEIISFDELFAKVSLLIQMLETNQPE